jgi:hypothetical protein
VNPAEPLREPLTDTPRADVAEPARREADQDAHGPRRISLCPRNPQQRRESAGDRGQTEKLPAWNFHLLDSQGMTD